eukprot:441309-Rhodomonas_salina.5
MSRKFVGSFILFSIIVVLGMHAWTISQSWELRPVARKLRPAALAQDSAYIQLSAPAFSSQVDVHANDMQKASRASAGANDSKANPTAVGWGCPLQNLALYGQEKILLITAVFGNLSLQPHFGLFLRSAQRSGFDFLVVGDEEPKHLPPNVEWLNVTWNELWWRVRSRVPHCFKNQTGGGDKNYPVRYKLIDLKPLFGIIFMRELHGYHFWGHVDNDMVFGRTRGSISRESMKADVIGIVRGS